MSHTNAYEFVFSLPEMPSLSFSAFHAMRLNGHLCDVTFDVGGKKIFAHRVILAANVPYFSEMFLHNFVEDQQREIIFFEMMESYAFESLIDFAYTNKIKINIDNAKSLLIGANLLKMNEIFNACMTFISRRLHPGSALEIKNFASAKNFVALKEAAEEYVLKHFVEISHSEEFLDMSFSDLKELISKDELHVASEEEVFQAVIAWVKKLPNHRKNKLPQLLSVVRMPLLSYHYLSTFVANEELIQKSAYCVNVVNEAKAYKTDRIPFHGNLRVSPRNFTLDSYISTNNSICGSENNYMYVLCRLKGKEGYPTVVSSYNLMAGQWKTMNSRTTFVEEAAVVIMDKKLYVIGGCNSIGRLLDAVQVFDTESDSWSFTESFPSKISQATATVCSGKIYVFGGKTDKDKVTKYMYCYSPETKWKYLDKMYQARRDACAVAINDHIYVLGGHNDDETHLKSVELYNPRKDEWKKISPLGMEINSPFSATSSINRIYVCSNGYVQFYDECLNEWDKICKIPKSSTGDLSIMVFGEKLYVIGENGEGRSHENYVYIYDLESDTWTNGKALPSSMHFISAVAIAEM